MARIDFEQARRIAHERGVWEWADKSYHGQYMVADYGFESEQFWLILDGDRDSMEGGPDSGGYMIVGRGFILVEKDTGEVHEKQYLMHQEMFDVMTPVGDHPPDGDEDGQAL